MAALKDWKPCKRDVAKDNYTTLIQQGHSGTSSIPTGRATPTPTTTSSTLYG